MRYALHDGPRHVLDDGNERLSGHYEATFASDAGDRVERFLTDKGRAELLRRLDEGQRAFTFEELELMTTPPRVEDLLAAMSGEGAEGA